PCIWCGDPFEESGQLQITDTTLYNDLIKRYGKRDVGESPISERGLIALKTAVKKVIEEHAR
ncbi:MAG TPA: hypothetical protein VJ228_09405, partial [Candidatus Acidoferrales bacterium]|nr:hypothetical protein [Candidatus Acidoferrales bacterium]